jgi:hypothetical protein
MPDYVVLCRVPTGLAGHVKQLLADAGVPSQGAMLRPDANAQPEPSGAPESIFVVVASSDLEQARSVIGLVLPQLLEADSGTSRLSDSLVRSEEPGIDPLPVWRGPAGSVLNEAEDSLHDEDGNFVPPMPPPVPRPKDRVSRFAWAGVLLGPVLTLVALVMNLGGLFTGMGIVMFFAGFIVLVARSPERAPQDDGWDNGAVL